MYILCVLIGLYTMCLHQRNYNIQCVAIFKNVFDSHRNRHIKFRQKAKHQPAFHPTVVQCFWSQFVYLSQLIITGLVSDLIQRTNTTKHSFSNITQHEVDQVLTYVKPFYRANKYLPLAGEHNMHILVYPTQLQLKIYNLNHWRCHHQVQILLHQVNKCAQTKIVNYCVIHAKLIYFQCLGLAAILQYPLLSTLKRSTRFTFDLKCLNLIGIP